MMKLRCFTTSEKRLLIFSSALCFLLLVLAGVYQWHNRVPDLIIPENELPTANAFHVLQDATQSYVPPGNATRIDSHIDATVREVPVLFSEEYHRAYPLARKLPYLAANAEALRLVREALTLEYMQPAERGGKPPTTLYSGYRDLARVLIVEAHARAQSGRWDDAADSLLDAMQLAYTVPRGGALIAALTGYAIRDMAYREFEAILPHLSAAKSRDAARKIEAWQANQVSMAATLEEEKRAMQGAILTLIRSGDLRQLYVVYGCGVGEDCDISPEQYQDDLDSLSRLLQIRLAWMNKPHLLEEYTRCMNWQIAEAKKPHAQRVKHFPFPESSDGVTAMIYPRFRRAPMTALLNETKSALLLTMLALRAYRLENGAYPESLSQLVPRYLSCVPLDPFSDRQTFKYRREPLRYTERSWWESTGGSLGIVKKKYSWLPFRLHSVGGNARDDSGHPYDSQKELEKRYRIKLDMLESSNADIVAGVNW